MYFPLNASGFLYDQYINYNEIEGYKFRKERNVTAYLCIFCIFLYRRDNQEVYRRGLVCVKHTIANVLGCLFAQGNPRVHILQCPVSKDSKFSNTLIMKGH